MRIPKNLKNDLGEKKDTNIETIQQNKKIGNEKALEEEKKKLEEEKKLLKKDNNFSWEIFSDELEFSQVIGQGQFGIVRRAKWRYVDCVVKTIKEDKNIDMNEIMKEINRMKVLRVCFILKKLINIASSKCCSNFWSML